VSALCPPVYELPKYHQYYANSDPHSGNVAVRADAQEAGNQESSPGHTNRKFYELSSG